MPNHSRSVLLDQRNLLSRSLEVRWLIDRHYRNRDRIACGAGDSPG